MVGIQLFHEMCKVKFLIRKRGRKVVRLDWSSFQGFFAAKKGGTPTCKNVPNWFPEALLIFIYFTGAVITLAPPSLPYIITAQCSVEHFICSSNDYFLRLTIKIFNLKLLFCPQRLDALKNPFCREPLVDLFSKHPLSI